MNELLIKILTKILPYREIGWKDINETFYRFTLLKTPWFTVYLHRLICETIPPHCHDHPWNFRAFILYGGYWEQSEGSTVWRSPFSYLYRPAVFAHKVWTKASGAWSVIVVGKKYRDWNHDINHC